MPTTDVNITSKYLREGLLAIIPAYETGEVGTIVHTLQGRQLDPHSINWMLKALAASYCLELTLLRRHYSRYLGVRRNISLPLAPGVVLLPVKMRKAQNLGESTIGYINLQQLQEALPLSRAPEVAPSSISPSAPSSAGVGQGADIADEQEAAAATDQGADTAAGQYAVSADEQETVTPDDQETTSAASQDTATVTDQKTATPACTSRQENTSQEQVPGEAFRSRVIFKNGLVLYTLNTLETLQIRICQGRRVRQDFLQRRERESRPTGVCREDIINLLPSCDCALKDLALYILNKGE